MNIQRVTKALIVAVWFCLVLPAAGMGEASAASRFDDGFRGIAWNTHKDQLPDLGLTPKSLGKIYASGPSSVLFMEGKGNLDLHFGAVPLLSIFLQFENQQFIGVDLLFAAQNRDDIVRILTDETGTPATASEQETRWQTERCTITVTDRELIVRPL